MVRSISRLASLALVPLAVFAFASAAPAKETKPKDAKAECESHLRKKIKAEHPGAHDIKVTISREWQQMSTQNGVGGTATLLGSDKKPRNLEWTCVFDTQKNKVIDVDFVKPKKAKK